jgi:hypothetical protein
MAIENAKTLNVRIKNKYDTYENWAASGLVLEAGEIAIAYTTVDVKVDNGTAKHPALLMKVGDGTKTFANLPWMSAKAADVLSVCKDETALTEFVNSVIADAGIASDDAMQALAGRVTTVENDLNTATTGLKARVTTAEAAIDALEELTGGKKVSDAISEAIAALNLATTYAAKVHTHEIADVNGLSDAIAAAKKAGTDANSALEAYKTLNDAAVKVNSDAIAGIKNGETLDNFKEVEEALAGKQAAGDYATKAEAQGYANAKDSAIEAAHKAGTDAAAAAAQALVDAKAYTDAEVAEWIGDKKVSVQISETIASYSTTAQMNSAIATAKGEAVEHANGLNTAMNTRVEALEAIDHTHSFVESELNLIKAGDVAKWNAAEQNAKDYADGLDEAMDTRMQAVEAKLGTGEGGVDAQIAAAVAAEAELREESDAGLQEQITENAEAIEALDGELTRLTGGVVVSEAIETAVKTERERAQGIEGGLETRLKAVEDTYATDSDITGLQNQINTIMSNPDAEGAINSINEFAQYVKDHGSIADGMRTDINKNKDDISGLTTRMGNAETAIGTKAAQSDLEALTGRVGTVESDLNTASTGLKARMTQAEADIEALEGYVGGKNVSEQITDVTNPLTERVVELEKVDHSHANAAELDLIASGDKAKWDAKLDDVTAAADSGLKATKTGNSVAIEIDDTLTWVFDCGNASV